MKSSLILPEKEFFQNPPFLTVFLRKKLERRVPEDFAVRIAGLIESAINSADEYVLDTDMISIGDELINAISKSDSPAHFIMLNSKNQMFLFDMLTEVEEKAVLENFPDLLDVFEFSALIPESYLVFAGRKEAVFYTLKPGELQEMGSYKVDMPKKVRYGGLLGFEENKIRRHIEHHERIFIDEVVNQLKEILNRERKKKSLIAATNKELMDAVNETFYRNFRQSYLGLFEASSKDSKKILAEKTIEFLRNLYAKKVEKLLNDSRFRAYALDSALFELNRRKPPLIAINRFQKGKGFYCQALHFSSLSDGKCPVCESELIFTENLLSYIAYDVYSSGGQVFIFEDENSEQVFALS